MKHSPTLFYRFAWLFSLPPLLLMQWAYAYPREAMLKLNVKNAPIESVLKEIEQQSELSFLYPVELLQPIPPVSLRVKNASVAAVLDQLFSPHGITYEQYDHTIVLKKQPATDGNRPTQVQEVTVSGQVTDLSNEEELPGVNILEKGTGNGTITDVDGNYRLTVADSSSVLVFSSVGYTTEEVTVGEQTTINMELAPNIQSLQEIVVVGYGEQERRDVTGSVATVDNERINDLPVSSFDQALAGQAPGVQVRQGAATPGGGPRVQIRGLSSIGASKAPLYVIDGFPIGNESQDDLSNPLSFLSPDDIESITILKDAASAAIYGSRANNGVVVITTKRGKTGKPTITLDAYVGLQTIPDYERPDVLNAEQLAQFRRESVEDNIRVLEGREPTEDDIPEAFRNPDQYGEGTNWFEEVTRNAPIQQYNLSLSGGSDNFKYYVSGGYFNQQGIIKESGFERYSFKANIDADITDRFRFGMSLTPSFLNQQRQDTDPTSNGFSVETLSMRTRWVSPEADLRDENGELVPTTFSPLLVFFTTNPLLRLQVEQDNLETFQILMNTYVEFDLLEDLTLRNTFGANIRDNQRNVFIPSLVAPGLTSTVAGPNPPPGQAVVQSIDGRTTNWLNENTLTYNLTLDEAHNITALAGFTVQKESRQSSAFVGRGFPPEDNTLFPTGLELTSNVSLEEWSLMSLLGRVNYDYQGKYYLTASVRRDGASRFGTDNRWGTFPAVSAAWRVSDEPFLDNIQETLSDLKLKASYGVTGNFEIGNYDHLGRVGQGGGNSESDYVFGEQPTVVDGRFVETIPRPDLGWEETRQLDLGVEAGFWENRVQLTVDVYQALTNSLIFRNIPIPRITGYGSTIGNLGEVRNRGLEIAINSRNLVNEFQWTTNLNFSINRNRVLSLRDDAGEEIILEDGAAGNGTNYIRTAEGRPIGEFYGLELLGLYTQAEVEDEEILKYPGVVEGAIRYGDGNNNGQLEVESDYVRIGSPYPDFTFGMTNTLAYRNFSLSIILNGAIGQQIFDQKREVTHNLDGAFNVSEEVLNRFRPGDDPTQEYFPTTVGQENRRRWRFPNSAFVRDADYLAVRNVTLSYNFTPEAIPFMQRARVYVSVQNALLFSEYDGNPEVFRGRSDLRVQNVDYGSYPSTRTFTLGTNITF